MEHVLGLETWCRDNFVLWRSLCSLSTDKAGYHLTNHRHTHKTYTWLWPLRMLNRFVWFMVEVSLRSSLKSGDETSARRVLWEHESRFFGANCRSNTDALPCIELIFVSSRTNHENKIRPMNVLSVWHMFSLQICSFGRFSQFRGSIK